MTRRMRVGVALMAGLLGFAAQATAQIPGMPLFTNPRYGTGLRFHVDMGQSADSGTAITASTVIQGGASLALGPVGINAMVGTLKSDLTETTQCVQHPDVYDCEDQTVSGAALAQIRLAGGRRSNLSLSVFGGAAMDVKAADFAGIPDTVKALLGIVDGKQLTIPVGVSVGLRIPLGLASLNLWGAPRLNLTRWVNCTGTCPEGTQNFRWAVGADLPIFRILSIRAAYDSGKIRNNVTEQNETYSYWGIGASIGIGGMR